MLDTYLKWFKSHERILIIAMALSVSAFGLNKWLDKSATDALTRAAVAQQIALVQHDADVKIAAAVTQQSALFQTELQARDQEMASLVASMASRDAATNKQVNQITQSKDIPQAVADLNAAYGATLPTPLTVTEAGSIPIADLQQFSVSKIEQGTLQSDLADTRKELDSTSQGLTHATALVGALQNQVTGLQTEIKTDDAASKAEIASVKADARKSKMTWFKRGVVVGFIAGFFTGHGGSF